MKNVKISIEGNDSIAPLCFQYPLNVQLQPAYLELYPTEEDTIELTADHSSDIGGMVSTGDVFDGKAYRFSVNGNVLRSALEALEKDEKFLKLIDDINFAHNNRLFELTRDLEGEIDDYLFDLECAESYTIGEYIADITATGSNAVINIGNLTVTIDDDSSEEYLITISNQLKVEVEDCREINQSITGDYVEFVTNIRDNL